MALISVQEIIDLLIMVGAVGFIFKDVFQKPITEGHDPLQFFKKNVSWENFKWAILVTAPAVVLHEAMHKITAILFGIPAVFHASYTWLGIGILLKIMNFGFIFFVPGYVSYPGGLGSDGARALIAFAGPATNLVLFLLATAALKYRFLPEKYTFALSLTKQINLFLFIFNMIPFPPFDGSHVLGNVFKMF